MSRKLSETTVSVCHVTAPRGEADGPLAIESYRGAPGPEVKAALRTTALDAQGLPPPFQRVLEVSPPDHPPLEVLFSRFCGVGLHTVVVQLRATSRVLPLDVWLAIADEWLHAVGAIPLGTAGARTVWRDLNCGVAISGELVLSIDEPNHVLAHWPVPPERLAQVGLGSRLPLTLSPEHARGQDITPASQVFSLAAMLVGLLTLEHPFVDDSELGSLQRIVAGDPRWTPARHPQCNEALAQVLNRALRANAFERFRTPEALRLALREAAEVAPASTTRLAGVLHGAAAAQLRACFHQLREEPLLLPATWNNGGLQVMEDRALESMVPLEDLPALQGAAPQQPRPSLPLRLNLARQRPAAWWQRLWPFS